MAERRMFTKKVTDDDNFMALSSSAQALYLHLSMSADDDGFCNQVSISMFKAHASIQDLQALLEKRYIYQFENGVIVIKHWRMANALRKDRYTPTAFQEELSHLDVKGNGAYTWLPDGCQVVAERLPQDRLGKDSLDKVSLVEDNISDSDEPESPAPGKKTKSDKPAKHKHGDFQHVLLTENEFAKLANDFGDDLRDKAIKFLDEYIEEKGYKSKSHNLAIRRWVIDAVKEQEQKKGRGRKEAVPSWMNKKSSAEKYMDYGQRKYSADELDDLEAKLSGVKTAGNDPELAARVAAFKEKLSGGVE